MLLDEEGGNTFVRTSRFSVVSLRALVLQQNARAHWSFESVVFQTRVEPRPLRVTDLLTSEPGAEAVQLPSRAWHLLSEPENEPVWIE